MKDGHLLPSWWWARLTLSSWWCTPAPPQSSHAELIYSGSPLSSLLSETYNTHTHTSGQKQFKQNIASILNMHGAHLIHLTKHFSSCEMTFVAHLYSDSITSRFFIIKSKSLAFRGEMTHRSGWRYRAARHGSYRVCCGGAAGWAAESSWGPSPSDLLHQNQQRGPAGTEMHADGGGDSE